MRAQSTSLWFQGYSIARIFAYFHLSDQGGWWEYSRYWQHTKSTTSRILYSATFVWGLLLNYFTELLLYYREILQKGHVEGTSSIIMDNQNLHVHSLLQEDFFLTKISKILNTGITVSLYIVNKGFWKPIKSVISHNNQHNIRRDIMILQQNTLLLSPAFASPTHPLSQGWRETALTSLFVRVESCILQTQ